MEAPTPRTQRQAQSLGKRCAHVCASWGRGCGGSLFGSLFLGAGLRTVELLRACLWRWRVLVLSLLREAIDPGWFCSFSCSCCPECSFSCVVPKPLNSSAWSTMASVHPEHASVSSVAEWKERRTGLPPPIRLPGRITQHVSFHPIVQLPGRQEAGPSAECSAQLIANGKRL